MNQLTLFDPRKLARRTDCATSHTAAAQVDTFRAGHEAKIFTAIADSDGLNYREIAALTSLEPVAVARRLSGMGERGLIERRKAGDDWIERDGCALWWARNLDRAA